MPALTMDHFAEWLTAYGRASRANDPQASAQLFAADARYYETPFAEPLVGRAAIYAYWDKGAQTLNDKDSSHEILAVNGNRGLARWRAAFTVIKTGQRMMLDCVFAVDFDEAGRCTVFREWWHLQTLEAPPSGALRAPL